MWMFYIYGIDLDIKHTCECHVCACVRFCRNKNKGSKKNKTKPQLNLKYIKAKRKNFRCLYMYVHDLHEYVTMSIRWFERNLRFFFHIIIFDFNFNIIRSFVLSLNGELRSLLGNWNKENMTFCRLVKLLIVVYHHLNNFVSVYFWIFQVECNVSIIIIIIARRFSTFRVPLVSFVYFIYVLATMQVSNAEYADFKHFRIESKKLKVYSQHSQQHKLAVCVFFCRFFFMNTNDVIQFNEESKTRCWFYR